MFVKVKNVEISRKKNRLEKNIDKKREFMGGKERGKVRKRKEKREKDRGKERRDVNGKYLYKAIGK